MIVSTFQDDITCIVVGEDAARDAEEGVRRLVCKKYGITLSDKKDAVAPFSPVFTSIGATHDASDVTLATGVFV